MSELVKKFLDASTCVELRAPRCGQAPLNKLIECGLLEGFLNDEEFLAESQLQEAFELRYGKCGDYFRRAASIA